MTCLPLRSGRAILLAVTLQLLAFLATAAPADEAKKAVSLAIIDANANVVPINVTAPVFAYFPVIPGAIVGKTSPDAVITLPATFADPLQLPLDRMALLMAPRAATLSEQSRQDGVTISPRHRRLARAGTFFARTADGAETIGAGLLDEKTRDTLFLVYFDGPCQLGGALQSESIELRVAVEIPAAGMHWLRITKTTPTVWSLGRAQPDTAVSLVTDTPP